MLGRIRKWLVDHGAVAGLGVAIGAAAAAVLPASHVALVCAVVGLVGIPCG